ncbi:3217_t:CDS:2, partial [Racocetra persica]
LLDITDPNNMEQNEMIFSQTPSTHNVKEDEHTELIRRDVEKGVITINEGDEREDLAPELVKLENIPRFEPLIKPHIDTSFMLGGLWGSTPQVHEKEPSFGYESLFKFSLIYQSHIKKCVDEICEDQRIVMETVKSADEYCAQINQSIITTQLQAKTNHEQISVVNGLIKQVEKTHKLVYEIFQTLNKLEKLIPDEGLFDDKSSSSKWPIIHKLCLTAKQKPSHSIKIPQRTNSIVVAVSQYNVFSDKHKDSEPLSPVQTTDWMSSSVSSVQNIILGENIISDRFRDILINPMREGLINPMREGLINPMRESLINPVREGIKRIISSPSINSMVSTSEPHSSLNNNGSEPPISPISFGSNLSNSNQSPPSGSSVSLLTDMLKRSALQKE